MHCVNEAIVHNFKLVLRTHGTYDQHFRAKHNSNGGWRLWENNTHKIFFCCSILIPLCVAKIVIKNRVSQVTLTSNICDVRLTSPIVENHIDQLIYARHRQDVNLKKSDILNIPETFFPKQGSGCIQCKKNL